jgi:heat induced stress protein YflT
VARSMVGLFATREAAEAAIVDLIEAGFDASRIGILLQDRGQTAEVAEEYGTRSGETAVAGGIVGGTAGALMAATGALVIPGLGPFIAGGIVATVLGAGSGALIGGLIGLGIPADEAEYYQAQVGLGRALVTVDPQGREDEARDILLRHGAEDRGAAARS